MRKLAKGAQEKANDFNGLGGPSGPTRTFLFNEINNLAEDRRFIGIECGEGYFQIASDRIAAAQPVVALPVPVNDNEFGAMSHWEILICSVLKAG